MQVVESKQHTITNSNISVNALKVLKRLRDSGFRAYLVGGSVRDLLLGGDPKDFDIATDALPEDVRSLFRNSRIIGKRFRINHIRFAGEIIEVATFRANHDKHSHRHNHSDTGMILNDNVYGSFEEDVTRRDFTVNALYYEAEHGDLLDYENGLADIQAKTLRLIGDPETRFREDPVRMLRAIRFAAKLHFIIDDSTAEPIRKLGFLIRDVPTARLFEEVLKLFMSGYAVRSYNLLKDFGMLAWLFPDTDLSLEVARTNRLIVEALASTDQRIQAEKPVTPAFVYAALLWAPLVKEKAALESRGMTPNVALHEASMQLVSKQVLFTGMPRRFSGPMKEIWDLQFKLAKRYGRRAFSLVQHRRFRAAYDFLLLREESGEDLGGLGDWWSEFQFAEDPLRRQMVRQLQPGRRKKKSRDRV